MSGWRIIGIGQPSAGDDGVGIAVLDHLRARRLPADIELCEIGDATALIPLLATERPVLIIDALVAAPVGRVRELCLDQLDEHDATRLSSHGLSLVGAIALARTLDPETSARCIRVFAVTIARPDRHRQGLSAKVKRAVPVAARLVLTRLRA